MTTNAGGERCHGTLTSTTVETVTLSTKVYQVAVINKDASNVMYVLVGTSDVSGAAAATNAGTVTAGVDESFTIPVSSRVVVYKNKRAGYVGLSVIGNGNAYSVHGTQWWD